MAAPRHMHSRAAAAVSTAMPTAAAATSFFPRRRFLRRGTAPARRHAVLALAISLLVAVVILLPGARLTSLPRTMPPVKIDEEAQVRPDMFKTSAAPRTPADAVDIAPPHPPAHADASHDAPVANDLIEADQRIADDAQERATALPPISAVVLFHNEYPTLNHTLETWDRLGLPKYVAEVLFFLNGVSNADGFLEKLPVLQGSLWREKVRVVPSPENLKLGLAIDRMVRLAKQEVVLLLEKDWALIEEDVKGPLNAAARLVLERSAHVVRFRHRVRPGAPLHARIMHENREAQILAQQPNLYCYLHHWVKNPLEKHAQFFHRCSMREEDRETWCAKAKYCQWTNNPSLFLKSWFRKELGDKYIKMYNETIKRDPNSGMLDFEFYTNWRGDVWNDRSFVVALPKGLFEHQEVGEQNLMNTVWYAWNRLNTDVEEKRRALFATEREECGQESKSLGSGMSYKDKFPIEFVRMYHYDKAMQRTVKEAVDELEEQCMAARKLLEDGHGSWRNGVTDLTNYWYKTVLYAYPDEPKDMNIAFVTALFSTADGDDAQEPSEEQVERVCTNLNILAHYKLIIYCTEGTKDRIESTLKAKYDWDDRQMGSIEFAVRSLNDMVNALLGVENVQRIKKAREKKEWTSRVRNRTENVVPSAQATSLSMSKPYILHEAMRNGMSKTDGTSEQETETTHYVWFDPESQCVASVGKETRLSSSNDHVLRGHMLMNTLATGVRVSKKEDLEAALRGSGFCSRALLKEMEITTLESSGAALVDFKTLGGSRLALTLMKGYYDVVLRDMLRRGYVGTGREAMSIAIRNVGYNFRFFNGAEACRDGDAKCGPADEVNQAYMKEGSAGGCKLYRWAGSCSAGGG